MSCGNPHDVACTEVLLRLHEYLDNEADALDGLSLHQIQHHLEECPPCLRRFGLEQMVRSLVQRSCGCHGTGCTCGCTAPGHLRQRIIAQLTTLTVHDGSTGMVSSRSEVIIDRHMGGTTG